MEFFKNISMRAKLTVAIGAMLLLMAILALSGYSALRQTIAAQHTASQHIRNVVDLTDLKANFNESRLSVMMTANATNRAEQDPWRQIISRLALENDQLLSRIRRDNENSPEITARLNRFESERVTYVERRTRILDLASGGSLAEAARLSANDQTTHYVSMRGMLDEMIKVAEESAAREQQAAQDAYERAVRTFLILGAVALVVASAGVYTLGGIIANPMRELLGAAEKIARGDLTGTVSGGERRDEIGALSRAFHRMNDNLRELQREVQEGVNVLAASASEIFTATSQIAAGASETATAVSQTTTTVEEVRQTAQISSQKANHVADVAQKAVQSAVTGKRSVDDSIEGMQRMREQMETIAESIVRLSEQSQAIGEIIATVNDLAEQSNLLAVNASIEAAKAGEHGRGFAVVAQEIRSLAVQSKEATSQVRSILGEIQKATTGAVMATEQGTKTAEAGLRQANLSGEAIRSLSESIASAAQAATQINASSQQQLVGVDQVAVAMENVLQASKQNAVGTQQAETGARNLADLGQKLKSVVQRYKL